MNAFLTAEPWIIGCVINLCGSVVINVGTNLIKYHHTKQTQHEAALGASKEQQHSPSQSSLLSGSSRRSSVSHSAPRSFWWYAGFTLFFIGNVSNFISMGFTAQSLLAGLGSIQFITNVLCSACILNHPVTKRVLWATLAIVIGNVLIVAYASHHSAQLTVNELWNNYTHNYAYQIYCAILVVLVLILYVYYKETKRRLKFANDSSIDSNGSYHSNSQYHSNNSYHHKLLPFSYAAISAIIGTQSVLLAKSSSELVRTTLGGNNQFRYPFTYFILCAWIFSMVFWLYRMNAALRKFDGVYIIPVLQVVWTLFSIVGGGIYFREFDFTVSQFLMFTIGVVIVMFGVYLLAPQPNAQSLSRRISNADESGVANVSHVSDCTNDKSVIDSSVCSECHQFNQCTAYKCSQSRSNSVLSPRLSAYQIRQLLGSSRRYSHLVPASFRNHHIMNGYTASTNDSPARSRSSSFDSHVSDDRSVRDHDGNDDNDSIDLNLSALNDREDLASTSPEEENNVDDSHSSSASNLFEDSLFTPTNHSRAFLAPTLDLSAIETTLANSNTSIVSPVTDVELVVHHTHHTDRIHLPLPLPSQPAADSEMVSININDANNVSDTAPLINNSSPRNHSHSHGLHRHPHPHIHAHGFPYVHQLVVDDSSPLSSRTVSQHTTPRSSNRTRARGMSLGFSMPMFEDPIEQP